MSSLWTSVSCVLKESIQLLNLAKVSPAKSLWVYNFETIRVVALY